MKFLKKDLTASSSGEQVKSAIPCTFRSHAAAVKSAGTIHYVDQSGFDKTFFALKSPVDPLFNIADEYDNSVITACLVAAGYRSGRDLTEFENAVKTAESAAAPLEKRNADLRGQAKACGESDTNKHAAIMAEIDKGGAALAAARDAVEKARAELTAELTADIQTWLNAFDKRAQMLGAVSEWLYNNAADKFAAIAAAADDAVQAHAKEFAGRMLAMVDEIVKIGRASCRERV